jgi:acetolactate synthase I/II/III large subunit
MNGAKLLVEELQSRGVTFVSTLCGHGLDPFLAAAAEAGLRIVDTRNEQAAAYIAEAYSRLSRRVGVCAVSSGVAVANALAGVVNAHFDGAPMLLISGCGALSTRNMGHFQDLDQVGLTAPLCKWSRLVESPDRIPLMISEAFAAATLGRPGPVHLMLPLDVQQAQVNKEKLVCSPRCSSMSGGFPQADPELVAETAKWIGEARYPLLIAGSGVFYAQGEGALREFAKSRSMPVVIPIWDRGSVTTPLKEFMGVLGAASGGPVLLSDSDLVILAGASFDYRVGYLEPPAVQSGARIVRIDTDAAELWKGARCHLSILASPSAVLRQLERECRERGIAPHAAWLREAMRRKQDFRMRCLAAREKAAQGLHALDLLRAIETVLTDESVLLIDGGNIGQWAHQILCDRYPGHWLTCGASAVVGWGLPGAIGARIMYPQRPIILLSGDGAFTFTIAELESARRQGMNFVTVVADDEAWGITLGGQTREFGHGMASELGPISFEQVAEGFGCRGVRVRTEGELREALREGLAAQRPTVIHAPIVRSSPAD